MTRSGLQWFIGEVLRYRPLATVVLAVALVCPPCGSWPGNLSAVTLLARLALALAFCSRARVGPDRRRSQVRRMHARRPAEVERFGDAQ